MYEHVYIYMHIYICIHTRTHLVISISIFDFFYFVWFQCVSGSAAASSVMVDLLVRVSDAPNNGNPPIATYNNNPETSSLGEHIIYIYICK